ncbi:MAG TPA: pilus assembly protein TadG-related protein [Anaerolineae bacterium]|nr:pilus assembly protein TadG-related protein [Anaerolineae bacterium]HOQ98431.1 pilus assembly protein TadG-related protein [Anaerolineae bacterium]HPL27012.1 pilus assembly protein TadG-related protein [Anaerolineae bacterium]
MDTLQPKGDASPRRRWERGQTLIVVAVLIVVLVAFLGFVIDGGNAYAQRRQMQNAADAAALAGAQKLAGTEGEVDEAARVAISAVAQQYAKSNGAESCDTSIDGTHVTVVVSKTVSTYFVPVIGIHELTVGAAARAGVYKVTGAVLPLTIEERPTTVDGEVLQWPQPDVDFTIWDTDPSTSASGKDDVRPQFYGWLNPNGGGGNASELKCWLECPQPCDKGPMPPIALDTWVNGDSGAKNSALRKMGECWENKVVLIPIYDLRCDWKEEKDKDKGAEHAAESEAAGGKGGPHPSKTPKPTDTPKPSATPEPTSCWIKGLGNGKVNYHIVRFMPFYITGVDSTGNPRSISGHIVEDYVAGTDSVQGYKRGFSDISTIRLEPIPTPAH